MTQALTNLRPGELPTLGWSTPDALTLGRLVERGYGVTNKIRYGGELHTLVLGANGKGKGTRVLMPNLLTMSGNSIVVVDPKGELAAVTAPFRRRLGPVVILNPFGVLTDIPGYSDLKSVGCNPLVSLDPNSRSFNVRASLFAEAVVSIEGRDPHWDTSARAMLAATAMYAAIEARGLGRVPTMARVRELICLPSSGGNPARGISPTGFPLLARRMMQLGIPALANKASQFTEWNNEIQSIASSAKRHTEAFDDPETSDDLAKNGIDFAELKKRPMTVYLILPPDMLPRHAKWLRLMLTSAIQAVLRPRAPGEPKVMFMLDEFFALGHLEIIQTVWSLVRGYGVQIMPILQDIIQLKKLYPEMWENFIGMAGAILSFGPNDLTTAKWLSERAGDTTRINRSSSVTKNNSLSFSKNFTQGFSTGSSGGNSSGMSPGGASSGLNSGWNNGHSTSVSTNHTQNTSTGDSVSETPVKVPLIAHHSLFGMKPGFMLGTMEGLPNMIPMYAPAYYQIHQCLERARANPYYLG